MNFSLITPTSKRTMRVDWLEIETLKGNLIIQEGYAPSIIMLKAQSSVIVGFSNNTTEKFSPVSGIMQVSRTSAQLLVDSE